MSITELTIGTRRTTSASGGLDEWSRLLRDTQPVLEVMGEVLREDLGYRLATGQDPWGNEWAPISPATAAFYESRDRISMGPLMTEKMTFEKTAFSKASGKTGWRVGVGGRIAKVHQFGNPDNVMFGGAGPKVRGGSDADKKARARAKRARDRARGGPPSTRHPIPARPLMPLVMDGGEVRTEIPDPLQQAIRLEVDQSVQALLRQYRAMNPRPQS